MYIVHTNMTSSKWKEDGGYYIKDIDIDIGRLYRFILKGNMKVNDYINILETQNSSRFGIITDGNKSNKEYYDFLIKLLKGC